MKSASSSQSASAADLPGIKETRDRAQAARNRRIGTPEVVWKGKWIQASEQNRHTPSGGVGKWELIDRTTRTSGSDLDGADCVALEKAADGGAPWILLVLQWREPVQALCLELPAGLMDLKDRGDARITAARELLEETGYGGGLPVDVSPTLVLEPGMSSCSTAVVVLHGIQAVQPPQLDPDEDVTLVRLRLDRHLASQLRDFASERPDVRIDAKLWTLALGLQLQHMLEIR